MGILEATSPFVFSTVNEHSIQLVFEVIACDAGKIGGHCPGGDFFIASTFASGGPGLRPLA
ncbi:MAG: hypothetical protein U1A22_02235 [Xanthomonadaceae bacterium]|nr:hypothetical protein [Xanthomonadaceae bacterium]